MADHGNPPPDGAPPLLPGVRHIIAVSSGKGGVGKSTVSVNVAVALARLGLKVGLLDADIYGPNVPIMFGIREQPVIAEGKIQPHERYGVRLMSLGFLIQEEAAVIWRGPMVMHALEQLMRDVNWGELDYLLVDMPPGTGDAQLTMVQKVPLAGAILVSTPQAVALGDTIKGLMMFRKTETPIIGMVENMSVFVCPHCHEPTELFRRGTVEAACERYGVPYLGDIPFDVACREGGDLGTPVTALDPDSTVAQAFTSVAAKVVAQVEAERGGGGRRVVQITKR
jgi:ATP-binding protein involved in chromosome partitioning